MVSTHTDIIGTCRTMENVKQTLSISLRVSAYRCEVFLYAGGSSLRVGLWYLTTHLIKLQQYTILIGLALDLCRKECGRYTSSNLKLYYSIDKCL